MKSTFALFVAVLLAIPTITKAVTMDGTADAQYGAAIVSQQLGTSTFKNTETNIDAANGSELDAAYGFISNGVLYLTFAGNLDTGGVDASGNPFDKLNIFFMTGPGGDHTLGTNYSTAADSGGINTMGVGGNGGEPGDPGLTFDTGFAANYWIGVTAGIGSGPGVGPTMYVNYEQVCSNCSGAFLGSVIPSNAPPGNIFVDPVFGIQAALNNSNTNGVQMDLSGCEVNGAPFNPQNVRTGVELAIPLSAIGDPTGQVSVCAFITDEEYQNLYNQVLAPINGGPSECQGSLADSSAVNFSTLPGQHFFTFTVPPCSDFLLTPTSASYSSPSAATGTVGVVDSGNCSWTATGGASWITIVSGGSGLGNGTVTYAVATNTTIDPRQATLIIAGQFVTQTVSIAQTGTFLPPLGSIIIDGTAESSYGCPLAVQQIGSGFGNNVQTNLQNNVGGSELDAAYGLVLNNVLYLTLAGNLEANGNELMIFFMTGSGGQNTLTNVNPNIGSLNSSGPTTNNTGPGLTFDPGFAPNYWIGINGTAGTPYTMFVDYAQLWPGSTNAAGVATNGYFVGQTTSTNGTLFGVANNNPFGIQATINNSNTNGVDGGPGGGLGCTTNSAGALESIAAAQVRTGVELAIPLGAIGSPTGAIAVCAYITGGSPHTYLSNQFLSPIGTNDPTVSVCQINLGAVTNSTAVNIGTLPGGPHFFLVGPEVRVTSIAVSNKNVNISYQTENNTNLLYRVERTLGNLATNSVWTPISGFTAGTGGILSLTDTMGGTNKPDALYRIRQTPQCQP